MMKADNEWNEDDATWKLLVEAAPKQASWRFADDTLRAVRLLPEADAWWPRVLKFSPWVAVAACGVVAAFAFVSGPIEKAGGDASPIVSVDQKWGEIQDVAEVEMLSAAADHLDDFSDQELVTLIGF